jgi:hypothetical protein
MTDRSKKITGVLRAWIITAVCFFFLSFLFKGVSFVVTVLLMNLGTSVIYVGVAVNVLGAAFAAWAGARISMIGREMKSQKSNTAAIVVAITLSALDFAEGLVGGALATMSGRGGSYLSTVIQSAAFLIVIFVVSRSVFKKREAFSKGVAEKEQNG